MWIWNISDADICNDVSHIWNSGQNVGAGRPLLRMFFPGCVCVRVRESRIPVWTRSVFWSGALLCGSAEEHPPVHTQLIPVRDVSNTKVVFVRCIKHHNIPTHSLSHHMHDGCVSDTSVYDWPGTTTAPHQRTKSPAAFLSFLSSRALRVLPFAICSTARAVAGCSRIVFLGGSKNSIGKIVMVSWRSLMDECVGKGVLVCVCVYCVGG